MDTTQTLAVTRLNIGLPAQQPDSQTLSTFIKDESVDMDRDMHLPWEAQMGWTYTGEGQWSPGDITKEGVHHGNLLEIEPRGVREWKATQDTDLCNHHKVQEEGYPNRWGARIPVKSAWNLELFSQLLQDYGDQEVVEWAQFGWPAGRLPILEDPKCSTKNHKGATDYPQHLTKYITKELKYGAVMGPFSKIPFKSRIGISPLSTRPKKGTEERRVILDLSFPIGQAVNDGIPADSYMGFPIKLSFPKTDHFAFRIFQLGPRCLMFKVNLSRYFRQIPLDPGDYSLIGYVIDGEIYFDKVLPMGMRSAPYIAQRLTNEITYIIQQLEYFLLNYVDDFVGAELAQKAWAAYAALTQPLLSLGVETAKEKIVPPTTRLEFLGITLKEIKQELHTWLYNTSVKRREIESLVGKLQFISKCVRPGRIFLARLIQWIREMDRVSTYTIPLEARKDIAWWSRFIDQYNGISLMWLMKEPGTDTIIQTDACLKGYGGICGQEFFRGRFPLVDRGRNIAILEMWAVMIAVKIWGNKLEGKYFWIHVDNEAVAAVLNSGKSREPELQKALREIAMISTTNQFVIKARHIPGVTNRIPDWLSRWDEPGAKRQFRQYAQDKGLKRVRTNNTMLQYNHQW